VPVGTLGRYRFCVICGKRSRGVSGRDQGRIVSSHSSLSTCENVFASSFDRLLVESSEKELALA
jgi:hypothetical protein